MWSGALNASSSFGDIRAERLLLAAASACALGSARSADARAAVCSPWLDDRGRGLAWPQTAPFLWKGKGPRVPCHSAFPSPES